MNETFKDWRARQPEPAMRMPWWRELKWWLAAKMLGWVLHLVKTEMTNETALAFVKLSASLVDGSDPAYNTVKMQPIRR